MSSVAVGGNRFKLLTPKEIASVLNRLGLHPQAAQEAIDKPTPEHALSFFSELADFSYDLDPQQVKAHLPTLLQNLGLNHSEIYEEAVDTVAVFKLARQLAAINLVEDFNLKDMWEPQPKRFRMLLSAIINCCRYKENKLAIIDNLKEDLHEYDSQRLQLVERVNNTERLVFAAQEQHGRELRILREAETEVKRHTAEVEKLQRQKASAERVADEAETGLTEKKARRERQEEETERLRQHVAELKEQVAESPEGIEQEITEQSAGIREHRSTLEDLSNEKRSRMQRDQVLARVSDQVEGVRELLLRLEQYADIAASVSERRAGLKQGVGSVRQQKEARNSEQADLQEKVRQLSSEQERAKEGHEQRVRELALRRQEAFEQHQHLQAKRNEEQKQQHLLQMQRMELEVEVSNAQRAFEMEMIALREKQAAIQRKTEEYMQQVDTLCSEGSQRSRRHGGTTSAALRCPSSSPPAKGTAMRQSPGRMPQPLTTRLVACTPSPARNITGNPLGLLSPRREF